MILKGLAIAEQAELRTRWAEAEEVATELLAHMQELDGIEQMEMAGSYRRGCETIGDLDLLVEASTASEVMQHFGNFPGIADVLAHGETKMSVRLGSGLQIDIRVVPGESFGAALQYFTGSKDHNVVVRGRAKQRGLKVNEWGVFRVEEDGNETYLAGCHRSRSLRGARFAVVSSRVARGARRICLGRAGRLAKTGRAV